MSYRVELSVILDEKPDPDGLINVTLTDSCIGAPVYYGDVECVHEIIEVPDEGSDER